MLAEAADEENVVEGSLGRFHFRKALRVGAPMRSLAYNALRSRGKTRIEGPLTT